MSNMLFAKTMEHNYDGEFQKMPNDPAVSQVCSPYRIYQRKQVLYSAGSQFEGLYQLRSGSAKATTFSSSGDEHITDFFYSGDIFGVDGFDSFKHSQQLTFLETSSIIFYTESQLNNLLVSSDKFRFKLLQAISHSLVHEQQMLLSLTRCSSEQRVAQFLLDLSKRFSERHCSNVEFSLSMTRTDIANYIGMALETLSRTLTAFQISGILIIKQGKVTIYDLDALNNKAKMDVLV